jgi:transposase
VSASRTIIDAASIEVSRRLRHVKTDRLDGERLLAKVIRHHTGEPGGWSVVRVPSVEEEDARRLYRELERLKREGLARAAARAAHRGRAQNRAPHASGGDRPDERLAAGEGILRLASLSQP